MRASLQHSVAIAGQHPAIPKAKQFAVRSWNVAAGIAMLAGVVYAFFGGWYWAPIGIVLGFMIAGANRHTAAQFVVAAASTNPAFKDEMVRRGVIVEP
jgi:hypothetical protein